MSMNIIHLGDLHLGVKFHKRNIVEEQRHALKQVIKQIDSNCAHLVIAGDVFDTVNPPIEAQELWYEFLECVAFVQSMNHTHTFIIPGNHDSAARLGLGMSFLKDSDIHIVHKSMQYDYVEIDGFVFVMVPFTKPETVNRNLERKYEDYDSAYKYVMENIKAEIDVNEKTIVIAHQSFEGANIGESEFKPFMSDAISLEAVKGFPLVLAGHLHEYQHLGNVHYSGSLLPYAFGDKYAPSVSMWTWDDKERWKHQRLPLSILHPLKVIKGDLEHCLTVDADDCYVKVKLKQCVDFETSLAKLQEKFPLLCSVIRDNGEKWVVDLDKPLGKFSNFEEAIDSFTDYLEIPRLEGRKKEIIQEALYAFENPET